VSDGEWTVPAIARRLGVTRQAVQRIADLLVADGLVALDDNPGHRRSPHVRLTAEGRAVLTAIVAEARTWDADVANGLSDADIDEARRVLRTVLDGIRSTSTP
jgi:DNA-binding MarR family transcriptional regulator